MEKDLRITASEARKITEESTCLLNRCYKWIKECAKENYNVLEVDVKNIDPAIIKSVEDILVKDEYTVKKDFYIDKFGECIINLLIIRW